MTKRNKRYFDKKAVMKWEQGMFDSFYCVPCQALSEYECMCDFLEEQEEMYRKLVGSDDDDF